MSDTKQKDDSVEALKQCFFNGMSLAAATVNVVTTDGPGGRAGVTVSAMSSVSADTPKPTLLVCVNEASAAAQIILENGVFCVNVLRDHQSYVSDVFAGRFNDQLSDKFDCAEWQQFETGAPAAIGALVAFDCKVSLTEKVGSHYVIFGQVQHVEVGESGSALTYANRAYSSAQPIEIGQPDEGDKFAPVSIGCFHTFAPTIVPPIMRRLSDANTPVSLNLVEGDNRRLKTALLSGEIDFAFLYDYDLAPELETEQIADLKPYVLLSASHPLAKLDKLQPEDLANVPMVSVREESSRVRLESVLHQFNIEPQVVYRSSSLEMTRAMVAQGLGFAIVMTRTANSRSHGGLELVSRELSTTIRESRIVLARKKGNASHSMEKRMLEIARTVSI